ncbi:MAG: hypothetical protein ACXVI6_04875 [Candidatus Aminicenantales bacterium]
MNDQAFLRTARRALVWPLIPAMAVVMLAQPVFCQRLGDPYTSVDFGLGFGAKALSMGGAFIADGKGLAAVGFNPAGLARLSGVEFNLGAGFGGQAASIPEGRVSYDDFNSLPPGSAYDWALTRASPRHAGVAAVLTGGGRIVVGVTYHREIDYGASYAYSIARSGTYILYHPNDPTTGIPGNIEQSEDYGVQSAGGLDVITGSLAFRVAKNVYLGANVNYRKRLFRTSSVEDYSFAFLGDGGLSLSGQGSIIHNSTDHDSTALNTEFGLQWVTRLFSVGFVVRTGSSVNYVYDFTDLETVTYSDGTSLQFDHQSQGQWAYRRPAQYGFGLSLRPARGLTGSVEYWTSDFYFGKPYPGVWDQLRTGAEYVLPVRGFELPLRAGWFSSKTDFPAYGGWAWIQGFTFGTGFVWKNMSLDIGALLHFKSYTYGDAPVTKMSSWDLVTTLTFQLPK